MQRGKRTILILAGWLAGGALLAAAMAGGLFYIYPPALDTAGKLLFRVAFWMSFLPIALLRLVFISPEHHHWPLAGWVAAGFLAPPLLAGACVLWRRAWPDAAPLQPAAPPAVMHDATARSASRRVFLRRAALAGGTALTWGTAAWGVLIEPQAVRLRRHRFTISDLPPALEGLRIVQIADTHFGPFIQLAYLQEVVRQANALKPDLIVLTGDYVHQTPLAIEPGIGLLAPLRARRGIAAVLGNHDHWEGAGACRAAFGRIGIPLIDNSRLFLGERGGLTRDAPAAGAGLCLAGVGDLWEDEIRLEVALAGVPAAMPRLVLSHNPDAAESFPPRERVDLVFAGHTHGGQVALPFIGPPILPSAYGQKYAGGLCQGPTCPVLVSRGIGMAVFPIRLGVPPELVEVTLTAGQK